MAEPIFVTGLRVNRHPKAPSFVIANLGVNVKSFKEWLENNADGEWVNIDIKLSKNEKYYAELNTYKKGATVKETDSGLTPVEEQLLREAREAHNSQIVEEEEINVEDIPF